MSQFVRNYEGIIWDTAQLEHFWNVSSSLTFHLQPCRHWWIRRWTFGCQHASSVSQRLAVSYSCGQFSSYSWWFVTVCCFNQLRKADWLKVLLCFGCGQPTGQLTHCHPTRLPLIQVCFIPCLRSGGKSAGARVGPDRSWRNQWAFWEERILRVRYRRLWYTLWYGMFIHLIDCWCWRESQEWSSNCPYGWCATDRVYNTPVCRLKARERVLDLSMIRLRI